MPASVPNRLASEDARVLRKEPTFGGDPTGKTDVTSSLRLFLERHDGQRVALAKDGRYRVTQLSFTAHRLTIDFRGARILGSLPGAHGIFRLQTSSDVVVNDPAVYGTGYSWDPDTQFEHGIQIDGGSAITLNNPTTRRTRGDGIYVGFQIGKNHPPTGVIINHPDVEFASRNGISPVAGEVTIHGGHVNQVGLHGIDFEPNNVQAGASIRGAIQGTDIRNFGQLEVGFTSYAVAAGGNYHGAKTPTKIAIAVENITGDCLRMTIRNTAIVAVRNNVSDVATGASMLGSHLISFGGNVRITGTMEAVEPCALRQDGDVPSPNPGGPSGIPGADWTLIAHDILYWLFVTVPKAVTAAGIVSPIS